MPHNERDPHPPFILPELGRIHVTHDPQPHLAQELIREPMDQAEITRGLTQRAKERLGVHGLPSLSLMGWHPIAERRLVNV